MPEKAKLLPVDRRGIAPIVIAVIAVVAVVAVVGVVYFLVLAPTTAESLSDILAKAGGVTGLQCDVVYTTSEGTETVKMYWEEGKMRMETTVEGESVIMIFREDTEELIMIYPAQNAAYVMSFTAPEDETPVEESEGIPTDTAEVIGTEVVDGKLCTVVQYTEGVSTVKAWIWTQYGIPLKVQVTTDGEVTTTEFKNVVVGDVPNSLFEVPPEVEIITMPGM